MTRSSSFTHIYCMAFKQHTTSWYPFYGLKYVRSVLWQSTNSCCACKQNNSVVLLIFFTEFVKSYLLRIWPTHGEFVCPKLGTDFIPKRDMCAINTAHFFLISFFWNRTSSFFGTEWHRATPVASLVDILDASWLGRSTCKTVICQTYSDRTTRDIFTQYSSGLLLVLSQPNTSQLYYLL